MTAPIPLKAELPLGDGPGRAHIHLLKGLGGIARRVALRALLDYSDDVLRDVYAAGIAHAVAMMEREPR